jgi:hypothetical protein
VSADASITADNLGTSSAVSQTPSLSAYGQPERVWVSVPAGTIGAGPSDDRMYVVDPIEKPDFYDYPYMPPFRGMTNPPVEPGPTGHFDHLVPESRGFICAHLYGSICRVLDIWESYLGRRIEWYFKDSYQRLELVPLIDWHNAQSGYGYMEFGFMRTDDGDVVPHALNFDVIAHEMGHTIMFSQMGIPDPDRQPREYYGFHEACADLTALISALHFDTVVDRLLRRTRGNLYTLNEINRIAEISDHQQIRIAGNSRKMSEVTDEVHDLSRPFTGAVFDILVDIYLSNLSERGVIEGAIAREAYGIEAGESVPDRIQANFDEAYRNRHFAFKSALFSARDAVGQRLAYVWANLSSNDLTYANAAMAFLEADRVIGSSGHERAITESFSWRGILRGE